MNLVFDGGMQGSSGDKFQFAGDGKTAGGFYQPSATEANAGLVSILGNTFELHGVEPIVVHGLPNFEVRAVDAAAQLNLGSVAVDKLNLQNLVLQTVTVDGTVAWSQKSKLAVNDAVDPRHLGRAMAISGTTLVVGAELNGSVSDGTVVVYEWSGSQWVEQAKLYPGDRALGGGGGFGSAVAISGNTMIIGAPLDDGSATDSGAVYVFARATAGGAWTQQAKLKAAKLASGAGRGCDCGRSVWTGRGDRRRYCHCWRIRRHQGYGLCLRPQRRELVAEAASRWKRRLRCLAGHLRQPFCGGPPAVEQWWRCRDLRAGNQCQPVDRGHHASHRLRPAGR